MDQVEKFSRRVARTEQSIKDISIAPRLPYSSIDGGSLLIKDGFGNIQGVIGEQWDGTTTSSSVGGTPPVSPTIPLVTPVPGGLTLYWDGTYVDDSPTRMDFRRVTFHAVTHPDDLDILSPTQICGEVTIATGGEVFASLPPVEHFIFAVTWNDSGNFSFESDPAFGTPLSIVAEALWQEHDAALAELDVAIPALQADLQAAEAQVVEIRDTTLPALDAELATAQDAIAQVQSETGILAGSLSDLQSQVDIISSDTGDVANIVDIISKTTRSIHGIY